VEVRRTSPIMTLGFNKISTVVDDHNSKRDEPILENVTYDFRVK
jgi:hypothetical protein